jgi:hypothetical protein
MNAKLPQVCPDCGEHFSARGLSGHRRLRHQIMVAPALPRDPDRTAESLAAIMNAIVGLQDDVLRIEQRVIALDNEATRSESREAEATRLEKELEALLLNIATLKRTGLAWTTIRRPASGAEELATLELARLRREQARIVFRMQELQQGVASDDRFLA